MKKFLFIVVIALGVITLPVSAQIEQGTILLGASSNAGFTSFDEDAGDISQFNIDVKVGYFIIENFAAGLNLGYSKIDFGDSDQSDTQFGIFARYYINGKIFVGAGYNSTKVEFDFGGGSDGESTVSSIPIEVGYAAFIGRVIAIEPAIMYTIYGSDGEGASFGFNVGLTAYLGRGQE